MLYCVLMPHFCTYTEYLSAHYQSRMRKMQSGERIIRISLSALLYTCIYNPFPLSFYVLTFSVLYTWTYNSIFQYES